MKSDTRKREAAMETLHLRFVLMYWERFICCAWLHADSLSDCFYRLGWDRAWLSAALSLSLSHSTKSRYKHMASFRNTAMQSSWCLDWGVPLWWRHQILYWDSGEIILHLPVTSRGSRRDSFHQAHQMPFLEVYFRLLPRDPATPDPTLSYHLCFGNVWDRCAPGQPDPRVLHTAEGKDATFFSSLHLFHSLFGCL